MMLDVPDIHVADWQHRRATHAERVSAALAGNVGWTTCPFSERCRRGTAVVCCETGERFRSFSEAGKAYRVTESAIRHAVRTGHRGGGLRWRRASVADAVEIHKEVA